MAGFGPPPEESRRRTNADTFDQDTSRVSGKTVRPYKPKGNWHDNAVDWWLTWRNSPQADLFTVTDWQRLQTLLPIVSAYHYAAESGEAPSRELISLMAEIRQNETLLGATHLDRLRGRIKVEQSAPEAPARNAKGVPDLAAERRKRLAGG